MHLEDQVEVDMVMKVHPLTPVLQQIIQDQLNKVILEDKVDLAPILEEEVEAAVVVPVEQECLVDSQMVLKVMVVMDFKLLLRDLLPPHLLV
jgi:hypothetical protein